MTRSQKTARVWKNSHLCLSKSQQIIENQIDKLLTSCYVNFDLTWLADLFSSAILTGTKTCLLHENFFLSFFLSFRFPVNSLSSRVRTSSQSECSLMLFERLDVELIQSEETHRIERKLMRFALCNWQLVLLEATKIEWRRESKTGWSEWNSFACVSI